jgi:hypothetical protein
MAFFFNLFQTVKFFHLPPVMFIHLERKAYDTVCVIIIILILVNIIVINIYIIIMMMIVVFVLINRTIMK